VKRSPLYIGVAISVALHGILILSASQLERPDVREQMRTVKLRMVKKAKEERDETKKKKDIKEALKKLEMNKKLKEASPEDLKKVKEAREKLAELRKKLAEEAKKRREELEKKKPEPKPEKKPVVKPEVKPPSEEAKKPAEKKPAQKKSKKKRSKKRSKKSKKKVKPAKGEKPAPPTPELAGARKGAAIDLEYTMKGGTSNADKGGSSVNVQVGDGMDVPEEGYNDDPATALSEQPVEGEDDGEEFQEEFQDADEEALPDEDGKPGPGGGPIKGKRKKDPRSRKVKTTSKHRVTREAKMVKKVSPEYPDELRALEIQGRVYLLVTVDKEGRVADVALKKGLHPKLDKIAVETAWELEFEPAMKEGEPVGVKLTVPFLFVLE